MKKDFSKNFWIDRYEKGGDSGSGSKGFLREFKANFVNNFCANNPSIESITELGCGDGEQLSSYRFQDALVYHYSYNGYDVSGECVKKCSELFEDNINKNFTLYRNLNKESNKQADLVMSVDVIFHLVEDDVYHTYMHNLFSISKKYVLIYSSNTSQQEENQALHVKHRKFTDWLKEYAPEFELIEYKKNKFPYHIEKKGKKNGRTTSFSDFYVFEKNYDYKKIIKSKKKEQKEKILVGMAFYNAEKTLLKAVNSILEQTYQNYELILFNDASTDNSYTLAKKIVKQDKIKGYNRIKLYNNIYNRGVWVSVNEILKKYENSDWDYFFHAGADDEQTADSFAHYINCFKEKKEVKICGARYKKGGFIGNSNGYGMVKRIVYKELGYYDNVRFGADTDLLERILAKYGNGASFVLNKLQIIMDVSEYKTHLTSIHNLDERMNYLKIIRSEIKAGLLHRKYIDNKTTVSIASIPSRELFLEKVINSIYKQVNYINVYLNEYTHIPSFLNEEKITVYTSQENGGDRGDNGKFYSIANTGFNLTLDDDIVVMNDYVKRLTDSCNNHRRNCFVSFYGSIFKLNNKGNINSFRRDRITFPLDKKEIEKDVQVDYTGSGVMCFHTTLIKDKNFSLNMFKEKNMSDIYVILFCQKNNIKRFVVKRKKNEFKLFKDIGIFQKSGNRDKFQTQLINSEYFSNIKVESEIITQKTDEYFTSVILRKNKKIKEFKK